MSDDSGAIRLQRSGATISLFASFIVLFVAAAAGLARLGFSDHRIGPLLNAAGVAWLLIHFPFAVRSVLSLTGQILPTAAALISGRGEGRRTTFPGVPPPASRSADGQRCAYTLEESWIASDAILLLAGLTIVTLIGQFTADAARLPGALLAMIGAAVFLVRTYRWIASVGVLCVLAVLAVALFISAFIAGASWGSGYHNPLFVEALGFGESNIDTLFHTSVCQMIRTYGVASTGVDGIPWLHYHFGSHWVFALLSRLLGMSAVDFFNVGYQIVIVPFCLHSLLTFADTLWGSAIALEGTPNEGGRGLHRGLPCGSLFWFVVCAGYAGVLPLSAQVQTPISRHSLIISESYALAIAVALLTAASLVRFHSIAGRRDSSSGRIDDTAGLLVFPVLVGAIGLIKLSVMIVAVPAMLYAFIRTGLFRDRQRQLMAAATLAAAVMAWWIASSPRFFRETGWMPFGFLRWNVDFQWWAYFWLAYYLWVWVYAAWRLHDRGVRTVSGLVDLFRRREAIDLEVLIVVAVVGAVPGILLTGYSGAHYFSECQRWLAIGFLLSLAMTTSGPTRPPAIGGLVRRQGHRPEGGPTSPCSTENEGLSRSQGRRGPHDPARSAESPTSNGLSNASLPRIAGIGIAICVVFTIAANTLTLLNQAVAINLASRGQPGGGTGLGRSLLRGDLTAARRILEKQAAEVETHLHREKPILRHLQKLDRAPVEEKRKTLLYIPKSNRQYWDLLRGRHWPRDVPFVAPALSGMAMVDGLFETSENADLYGYGYDRYERPAGGASSQPPPRLYRRELCRRAAAMGFEKIIVLTVDDDSAVRRETWTCATTTSDSSATSDRSGETTAD